ncbi:MAG TPA: glutamate-5-semialdehyde dehydrogenase [Clostridiales bacterium]|nr:glutamate-5-semialdehyde dehydrogenase [Clostridiales bacterium]
MSELENYIAGLCCDAKEASRKIVGLSTAKKNAALYRIADTLERSAGEIEKANEIDLVNPAVPPKMLDRLKLGEDRVRAVAAAVREVAALPDPVGGGERWVRPNGLIITRERVPLGVVAIIYEARPNVTVDAASLCIKTGNAVVLRGGKEAINTNRVLVRLMREALEAEGIPADAVSLVDDVTREGTAILMRQRGLVDVLIPRGGASLIKSVVENAKVPVIETGAGNCHVYIDKSADIEMAVKIAANAKVSRPSVCNAAETLLVHKDVAREFLPKFAEAVSPWNVELRGCGRTREILPGIKEATEEDYYTEYNDYILAVKVVDSIDEAIAHINKYGTMHSEAIVTRELEAAEKFRREVDAAAVYVNASTRFTDGGEFGFGAEIGISTQKLHARGPMGLAELTTVKYYVLGSGQVR